MNQKQRDYMTSLIKILFTILVGGLAAGKLFDFHLNAFSYVVTAVVIIGIGVLGYTLQKE